MFNFYMFHKISAMTTYVDHRGNFVQDEKFLVLIRQNMERSIYILF